jgi:lipopolysaccharide export system permease protein
LPLVTRYILWELLKVFLATLTGLTGMVVLIGVAQEAIRQGMGPLPILRMIPFILPDALRFSVPATILLAVCCVYGRMSGLNEIVAAKSLGIAPLRLISPALAVAFCVSLVAVWLNDVAVTWGRTGVRRVIVQSVEEIAYGMLRTQRSFSDDRFSINVKDVEGRRLIRPTITMHGSGNSSTVMLTAEEAELRFNADDSTLSIFLTNGSIDVEGEVTAYFPDRIERRVGLGEAKEAEAERDNPSHTPLWRIGAESAAQRQRILQLEQSLAVETAYYLSVGDFTTLAGPAWRTRYARLQSARERLHRLSTEPWRRWANGFSCFFFCLVGAPLAVKLRKSEFLTVFFICFLPILVFYYPLMALGVDLSKTGDLPPYSVWLGNGLCLVAGVWLIRSVERH